MEHDLEKMRNLKLILSSFYQLSGLEIDSSMTRTSNLYVKLFGCGLGSFPISYLGILIHHWRLTLAEWKLVEERLQKHLSSWKGKLLSLGGR
jgi:hypothetical protein